MKKGIIGLAVVLSLSLLPAYSATPPKAGSACSKQGVTKIYQGKTFKCIKSGKKLVWNRSVATKKPIPTPTPTPPPTPTPIPTPTPTPTQSPTSLPIVSPLSDFEAVSVCKLSKPENQQMDDGETGSVGFPRSKNAISSEGEFKVLLLFVDFPDVRSNSSLLTSFEKRIPIVENFFQQSSYGKFKIQVEVAERVYRLQNPSTFYNLTETPGGGPMTISPPKLNDLLIDSMTMADGDIDFSKYLFVSISSPLSETLTLSGAFGTLPTNTQKFDGVRYYFASFEPLDSVLPDTEYNKIWNWAHDIGHMLGLMHPFEIDARNAWDIMFNFASQPDFLGWNKWKLNWITDEQVYCLRNFQKKPVITFLSPIGDAPPEKKLLVIPFSPYEALVVEVRRKTAFDRSSFLDSESGVIVYRVDTRKQGNLRLTNEGPFKLLSNLDKRVTFFDNRNLIPYTVGTLKPGESLETKGIRIEVLMTSVGGDYVSIEIIP